MALGLTIYSAERAVSRAPHPRVARAVLRFEPMLFDARACTSAEELATLILASSATPPFTPVGEFRGRRLLDGGMVDNVPAALADALPGVKRNLVLMTRPYHASVLGERGTRLYIAPTQPTPITRWDYTAPERLAETIAMGEREAALHQNALNDFLSRA